MESEERVDKSAQDSGNSTLYGCFFALFGLLRALAIVAALAFAGTGAYLGYELFYFLRDIVHEPTAIVREWQIAVQEDDASVVPATVETKAPSALAIEAAAVASLPEPSDTGAVDFANAVAENDDAGEVSEEPGVTEPIPAVVTPVEVDVPEGREEPRRTRSLPQEAPNPWLVLGERLLEALEAGEVNWLVGLLLLVIFCWLLVKLPVLMISTGGKVLVDLFKLGRENK